MVTRFPPGEHIEVKVLLHGQREVHLKLVRRFLIDVCCCLSGALAGRKRHREEGARRT
jgi:hypothetical protein